MGAEVRAKHVGAGDIRVSAFRSGALLVESPLSRSRRRPHSGGRRISSTALLLLPRDRGEGLLACVLSPALPLGRIHALPLKIRRVDASHLRDLQEPWQPRRPASRLPIAVPGLARAEEIGRLQLALPALLAPGLQVPRSEVHPSAISNAIALVKRRISQSRYRGAVGCRRGRQNDS